MRRSALPLAVLALASGGDAQTECPPSSAFFPWDSSTTDCQVVTFAGAVVDPPPPPAPPPGQPPPPPAHHVNLGAESDWWEAGLRMYANHTNAQGGMRLGRGKVGYVNIQLSKLRDGEARTFEAEYGALCKCKSTPHDPRCRTPIRALLAPISSKSATAVLDFLQGEACTLPFLAADVSADLFAVGYPNLWSVSGSAGDPLKFLRSLGAQYEDRPARFAVVAQEIGQFQDVGHNITDQILNDADLQLAYGPQYFRSAAEEQEFTIEASETPAEAFVGMGDLDAFVIMLGEFKRQKYEPRAAYLVGGLTASPYMLRESYTQAGCTDCLVFNQWMGDLPWSADMPYAGQRNW